MTLPIKFAATGPEGWAAAPDMALDTATLLEGVPYGRDHAYYTNDAVPVKAGIWRSTPYTESYESYPCDEFMLVLEGSVTLESEGFSQTYAKGDAFLLPKGFRGIWRQTEPMLKYYVLVG
jgi:uncharacterized cupin superfamily protein